MLSMSTDLFLKETIELYDNLASSGKCNGRLQAKLQVFPTPSIIWEFESLGDRACEPAVTNGKLDNPLVGSWFSIEEPFVSGQGWGTLFGQSRVTKKGVAREASFGKPNTRFHSLKFFLPNARFLETNLKSQKTIEEIRRFKHEDESHDFNQGAGGRFIEAPINEMWYVHLRTYKEALDWLNPRQENVGTYITTVGWLKRTKESNKDRKGTNEVPNPTMDEALPTISTLSSFLSFANGGYLGPLCIEGFQKNAEELEFAARVLAYRTTPLEQIGITWLRIDSDLGKYLHCFSTFDRMCGSMPWKETFGLVLTWYFQAIQPQNAQSRGKPWPIVANAIGAALERLGVAILVKELNIRGLKSSEQRTKRLLEKIGITEKRGYNDVDCVKKFVELRNNATHPISTGNTSDEEINQILDRAIQWVEEVLLWRLGYNGKYCDRTNDNAASTVPRYDLSTRAPNW